VPTVRAHFIPLTEKPLLAFLLLFVFVEDDIRSGILVVVGFLLFLALGLLCFPPEEHLTGTVHIRLAFAPGIDRGHLFACGR
jgi:hypothetical protein